MKHFSIQTRSRTDFVKIDRQVAEMVRESAIEDGVITVFIPHTTAGITINENADPDANSALVALAIRGICDDKNIDEEHRPHVVAESVNHLKIPHLKRAVTIHGQLGNIEHQQIALHEVIDRIPTGVIILDTRSRPVVVNRMAARILGAGDVLLEDATAHERQPEQPGNDDHADPADTHRRGVQAERIEVRLRAPEGGDGLVASAERHQRPDPGSPTSSR